MDPARQHGVWTQMPFLRGQTGAERLVEARALAQDARDRAAARRERVLALPWAAARLRLIFGYADARQWTGYVPPRITPYRDRVGRDIPGGFLPENSPLRLALIGLLREVDEHDRRHTGGGSDSVAEA